MSDDTLLLETHDDVAVLRLNRPASMNAMTGTLSAALTDAVRWADAEPGIGAIVITGAGRAFCAGADMSDSFDAQLTQGREMPHWQEWVGVVRAAKPVVAAVNGVAYGVGVTMILPADRIVAARSARFSFRFVRMGLVPELGSTYFLPQRVGFGVASDLMLSGRTVDAQEAVAIGLADELAGDSPDDSALLDTAIARARSYGAHSADAVRGVKRLLSENAADVDLDAVQARELALLLECFASPEHAAAVRAFLERR